MAVARRARRASAAVAVVLGLVIPACASQDPVVQCTGSADNPHRGASGTEAGRVVGKITVKCTGGNVDVIETDVHLDRLRNGVWSQAGGQVKGSRATNTNYLQGVAATSYMCQPGTYRTWGRFRTELGGASGGWNDWAMKEMYVSC